MRRHLVLTTFLLLAAYSAAAASLSRPAALAMIQKDSRSAAPVTNGPIGGDQFNAAIRDGLVVQKGTVEILTPKGQQYFTSYNFSTFGGAELKTPARRVVTSVTGIREGDITVAEFTWHLEALTAPAAEYTTLNNADQTGDAWFRRYDDGWRVTKIDFRMREQPNTRPLAGGPVAAAQPPGRTLQNYPPFGRIGAGKPGQQGLVSLGTFIEPDYQLTIWRDMAHDFAIVGTMMHVVEGMNDPSGILSDIVADPNTGALRFKARLRSETVMFNGMFMGVIRGDTVEGVLTSTLNGKPRKTTFKRGEVRYDTNYATRDQWWSTEVAPMLKCCGPQK
jgi:hypothetical protein